MCRIIYPKNTGDEQIMLTLTAAGKSPADVERLILEAGSDDELKILVDGPMQASEVGKVLSAQGFNDVVPEDDDGMLYLLATKKKVSPAPAHAPVPAIGPAPAYVPDSTGVRKLSAQSPGLICGSQPQAQSTWPDGGCGEIGSV